VSTSASPVPSADRIGTVLARAVRNHRLGRALLVAGAVVFVACLVWGVLLGGSAGTGAEGLAINLTGSGGFGLMLAGAIIFAESRAFLRDHEGLR